MSESSTSSQTGHLDPVRRIDDREIQLVDPKTLTDGVPLIPGLSTAHYPSIRDGIARSGQQQPILATEDGVVHDGRLVRRACEELGINVRVSYISADKAKTCWLASSSRRELTIPDRARIIAYIRDQKLYMVDPLMLDEKEAVNEQIASYVRSSLGWVREATHGKQVQRFLKFHKLLPQVSEDLRPRLASCQNINKALRLVTPKKPKKSVDQSKRRTKAAKRWVDANEHSTRIDDDTELEQVKAAFVLAGRLLSSRLSEQDLVLLVAKPIAAEALRTVA
jgi:hypothetical protein